MDDAQIHSSIEQLVAEEHELWERGSRRDRDRRGPNRRLASLKLSLDQFWDLLRQRRALPRESVVIPRQPTCGRRTSSRATSSSVNFVSLKASAVAGATWMPTRVASRPAST